MRGIQGKVGTFISFPLWYLPPSIQPRNAILQGYFNHCAHISSHTRGKETHRVWQAECSVDTGCKSLPMFEKAPTKETGSEDPVRRPRHGKSIPHPAYPPHPPFHCAMYTHRACARLVGKHILVPYRGTIAPYFFGGGQRNSDASELPGGKQRAAESLANCERDHPEGHGLQTRNKMVP